MSITERRAPFGTVSAIVERNHARKGKLNDFQRDFAREYVLDHDRAAAYIRAGGDAKNPNSAAAQQLKRPAVKAEVARLEERDAEDYQRRVEAVGLTKDWVIAEAMRNVKVAAGYEPITVGEREDGTLIKAYRPDTAEVRAQLSDLMDALGMRKQPVQPPGGTVNNLNLFGDWPLGEITAFLAKARAELAEGTVVHRD